jgi:anti-sigma factor RsiW
VIDEQLEFQISQYADGTLPPAEAAALEAVLATSAEARALLEEYRTIDASLKRDLPLPAMNWDRLADHLSDAVAREDAREAARTARITLSTWWVRPAAVAAAVLLAIGTIWMWPRQRGNSVSPGQPKEEIAINSTHPLPAPNVVAVVDISGPAAEPAAAAPVVDIAIDATPLAKRINFGASETVVYRAPRVVIASGAPTRQDVSALPY